MDNKTLSPENELETARTDIDRIERRLALHREQIARSISTMKKNTKSLLSPASDPASEVTEMLKSVSPSSLVKKHPLAFVLSSLGLGFIAAAQIKKVISEPNSSSQATRSYPPPTTTSLKEHGIGVLETAKSEATTLVKDVLMSLFGLARQKVFESLENRMGAEPESENHTKPFLH